MHCLLPVGLLGRIQRLAGQRSKSPDALAGYWRKKWGFYSDDRYGLILLTLKLAGQEGDLTV